MLGRHPPRRATSPAPSSEWCIENVQSITKAHKGRGDFYGEAPVHIMNAVWSSEECFAAMNAAEAYNQWQTGRHHLYPTTDVPAGDLPFGMGKSVLSIAQDTILPAIAAVFETPVEQLSFKDMFLAKYTPTGQPGLGAHTDGSAFSFNMLLSDASLDFEGGGTHIEPLDMTVKPLRGEVLLHRGSVVHAGCSVTKGSRYVLVGFVNSDDSTVNPLVASDKSKLLLRTIHNFPLGMVIEVDEGDEVSCAMVMNVKTGGAAWDAGVRQGDCLRGIFIVNDDFICFDGQHFDRVIEVLSTQKAAAVRLVVERYC